MPNEYIMTECPRERMQGNNRLSRRLIFYVVVKGKGKGNGPSKCFKARMMFYIIPLPNISAASWDPPIALTAERTLSSLFLLTFGDSCGGDSGVVTERLDGRRLR